MVLNTPRGVYPHTNTDTKRYIFMHSHQTRNIVEVTADLRCPDSHPSLMDPPIIYGKVSVAGQVGSILLILCHANQS